MRGWLCAGLHAANLLLKLYYFLVPETKVLMVKQFLDEGNTYV